MSPRQIKAVQERDQRDKKDYIAMKNQTAMKIKTVNHQEKNQNRNPN